MASPTTAQGFPPPPAPPSRTLHEWARWGFVRIEYAYLMRFPILGAIVLVALLPLGYALAPTIFKGVFDARGPVSFLFVVMMAFLLSWTIMVLARLVLAYGADRFTQLPPLRLQVVNTRIVASFGSLALPVVVLCWIGSQDIAAKYKLTGVLGGLLLALLFLLLAAYIHFEREPVGRDTARKVLPSFWLLKSSGRTERDRFWGFLDRHVARLPEELRQGYLLAGRLRSGFEMSLILFILLTVFYSVVGIAFAPRLRSTESQPAALFYVLLLLVLLTWFFSGIAFVLDRFRIPVLTTALAISLIFGVVHTDHEFAVSRLAAAKPPMDLTPQDVVRSWDRGPRARLQAGPRKKVVVVATAGGGIQAAAWTTRVLTGIESQCEQFDSSLLLVSSVSGGSVGAMYFLANYAPEQDPQSKAWTPKFPHDESTLRAIRFNSKRSSLSAVGWGLLYPDLFRTIPLVGWSLPATYDRGWAIENAWISGWSKPPDLSDWREDVAHGTRPAVIFNATVAESGQRFISGSADVLDRDGTVRFAQDAKGFDMPVATAARLSATFPYVSPIARASDGPDRSKLFHVADGGYYDNSGILSAVEWLREAAPALAGHDVLLLLIDGAPKQDPNGQRWSWQRQVTGPLETIVNVRTSSQRFRDQLDTEFAQAALESPALQRRHHASAVPDLTITPVTFIYPKADAPLSWHLNRQQRAEVEAKWKGPWSDAAEENELKASQETVTNFLGCKLPEQQRVASLPDRVVRAAH